MMCNGEIYNHLSLRKGSAYKYRTDSDCEAVLAVYSRMGVEGFRELDGMYAAAIYDARDQMLILHRDGIGKNRCSGMLTDHVIFSSNVHAITSNLRRAPELDLDQVRHYFRNGFVHPKYSIYHGIRPVLPGEIIRIDLRSWKIHQAFVEVPDNFDGFDYSDSKTVQSKIESLIDAAVQKRIHGLVHPVIMFSGGIDSTVVATACKAAGECVLMTLKQPIPWLNDEPFAKREARRLGLPLAFQSHGVTLTRRSRGRSRSSTNHLHCLHTLLHHYSRWRRNASETLSSLVMVVTRFSSATAHSMIGFTAR